MNQAFKQIYVIIFLYYNEVQLTCLCIAAL